MPTQVQLNSAQFLRATEHAAVARAKGDAVGAWSELYLYLARGIIDSTDPIGRVGPLATIADDLLAFPTVKSFYGRKPGTELNYALTILITSNGHTA